MKINVKKLKDFISRVHLKGINDKCVINFDKDGMIVQVKNVQGTVGVRGFLKKEAIKDYQEIGKIGIMSLDLFMIGLGAFSDKDEVEITFERDGKDNFYSRVTINNDKKDEFSYMLCLVNSLTESDLSKVNEIPFEEEVELPIDKLKQATGFGNSISAEKMTLNGSSNIIILDNTNGMGTNLKVSITLEKELKNDYSIRIPNSIFKMIESINSNIKAKLHTDDNVPFIYTNNDGDNEFTFVIAKKSLED